MSFKNLAMIAMVAGLSSSCNKISGKADGGGSAASYSSVPAGTYADGDFSKWMSKADQQLAYEKRGEGKYFAYTEGRNNGGFLEYRHVVKPIPKEKIDEWGIFWGLDEDKFYEIDLKMQRSGFIRESVQVFHDNTGVAYHQAIWVKPKAK